MVALRTPNLLETARVTISVGYLCNVHERIHGNKKTEQLAKKRAENYIGKTDNMSYDCTVEKNGKLITNWHWPSLHTTISLLILYTY